MTDERREPDFELLAADALSDAAESAAEQPLDPWMATLAREAVDVDATAIPREMMWARLKQQRRQRQSVSWGVRLVGIAALLVAGVGVGRYLLPATGPSKYQLAGAESTRRADSITALGLGPEALAALPPSSEPVRRLEP